MKKYIIILFNALLLLLLLWLLNTFVDLSFRMNSEKNSSLLEKIQTKVTDLRKTENENPKPIGFNDYTEPYLAKKLPFDEEHLEKFCREERFFYGEEYKKNPIILLGCSYTYGHGLKKEETFPFYLSKITERPVLNFAKCGYDIILSFNDMFNYIQFKGLSDYFKSSDYVIYTYMFDHISRFMEIRVFYNYYDDIFSPKGLEKSAVKIPLFRYFLASYRLQKVFQNYPNCTKACHIMKKIIILFFKKAEKYAPNSKKIIILYDEKIPDDHSVSEIIFVHNTMNSPIWQEIEEETDIKILHTKDLAGFLFDKNYKIKEDIADWHPNGKAWKLFTPLFAEKYIK